MSKTKPLRMQSVNDPCVCDSGKKLKHCCKDKIEEFERTIRRGGYPVDMPREVRHAAREAGHPAVIALETYREERHDPNGLSGKLAILASWYSRTLYENGFHCPTHQFCPSYMVGRRFMDLDTANGLYTVRERVTHEISQTAMFMFSATMDGEFEKVNRAITEIPDNLVLALSNTDAPDRMMVTLSNVPARIIQAWIVRRGSDIYIVSLLGWKLESNASGNLTPVCQDENERKLCDLILKSTQSEDGQPAPLPGDEKLWSMIGFVHLRVEKRPMLISRTLLAEVGDQFITASDNASIMRAAYENSNGYADRMASYFSVLFSSFRLFDQSYSMLWLPRFARVTEAIVNESSRKKENDEFLQLQSAYIEELERDRRVAKGMRLTAEENAAELAREVEERDNQILSLTETVTDLRCAIDKKPLQRAEPGADSDSTIPLTTRLTPLIALPRSPLEAFLKIKRAFKDRLVFLPEAEQSMRSAAISSWDGGAEVTWKCLMNIAVHLWDLYFEKGQPKDIRRAFQERSGLEFATTESPGTKADADLMKLRERIYNGELVHILPHVIWGNEPGKLLRVHLHVDRPNRLIVIGHCGDHLPIASTKS